MKAWRLMVWTVPDRLSALLERHGFRPTKKNPSNWWRLFDPTRPEDKIFAEQVRTDLMAAGLKGKWSEVTVPVRQTIPTPSRRPQKFTPLKTGRKHKFTPFRPSREGFGGKLNARPTAGSWRRKIKRQ